MSESINDHWNKATVTGSVMSTDQEAFPKTTRVFSFWRWRERQWQWAPQSTGLISTLSPSQLAISLYNFLCSWQRKTFQVGRYCSFPIPTICPAFLCATPESETKSQTCSQYYRSSVFKQWFCLLSNVPRWSRKQGRNPERFENIINREIFRWRYSEPVLMALSGSERTCQRDHSTTVENLGALRQKKSAYEGRGLCQHHVSGCRIYCTWNTGGMVINSVSFCWLSIYLQRN